MTDFEAGKEARLAAFFAADEPPVRDPVFEAAVRNRWALRRGVEQALDMAPLAAVTLAIAWALWPALARLMGVGASQLHIALSILAAAALAGGSLWIAQRLRLLPPMEAVL